jgi:7,8-dihydropterin-6-yl-methyl-4-(beta-D-ribofuranosyl)aminobenzene 5'-phosphate synthase
MKEQNEGILPGALKDLSIKVVCDNNPYKEGLGTAWGFSCLIAGTEKTILLDTGPNGSLLLDNMAKLEIDPRSIDIIVLSHIHGDHTGGLHTFLERNSDVTVYLPKSSPGRFKHKVEAEGAQIVEVEQPLKIHENVHSTGQLGRLRKEQSLIIETEKGLIVITGCAHPGIVKIINAARELLKKNVFLVMGGFHLEWMGAGKTEKNISAFKQLNVQYVGPCHCSGNKARRLFEKHFGQRCINIGAGKVIDTADL